MSFRTSSAGDGVGGLGTQACLNSTARFSQVYPIGLTRSVTYLAGSTVFYKQEQRKSSPRQSARAGEAASVISRVQGSEESTVAALGGR